MGVDFVKVYFSRIDPEVHATILEESKKLRLAVTGHLPHNLSFRDVTLRGQHLEHWAYAVLDGASTRAAEIRPPTRNRRIHPRLCKSDCKGNLIRSIRTWSHVWRTNCRKRAPGSR